MEVLLLKMNFMAQILLLMLIKKEMYLNFLFPKKVNNFHINCKLLDFIENYFKLIDLSI